MRRSWERWPIYPREAKRDLVRLLRPGTRLTALRANPTVGPSPTPGSWCAKLEAVARRMTGREAIGCANATLGLIASLRALDLPPGSRVATPAFTFSATTAAIVHAGLTPVFCDIHPETMTLVVPSTLDVAAVLPVDLFGKPHLGSLHTPRVQDASQAVGSDGAGRHAYGDLVVWSFNGRKNVPAGEAGLVLARDPDQAQRVRLWLSHAENFGVPWVGLNGHLHEMAACLATWGLLAVHRRNRIRQQRAGLLNRLLAGLPVRWFPVVRDHAFYVYPIILDQDVDRARLVKALTQLGVVSQPGYIQPTVHEYSAFRGYPREPLPVTEELSRQTLLLLPTQITSETTVADVRWLATQVRAAFTVAGAV